MSVLILYTTESGDNGIVGIFEREPTREEEMAIIEKYLPHEIYEGVCYAFLQVENIGGLILPVPTPTETSKLIERI